MRSLSLILGVLSAWPVTDLAAASADPQALEEAWHACLREAQAHQPTGQSRAGDERNALDECKAREDAYVAAVMAAGPAADSATPSEWTRAWAAFAEPLAALIKGWVH